MSFITSILIAGLALFSVHPIHVSICEINHSINNDRIEIKIRIFADDFEDVLEGRNGVRTKLGTPDEIMETDSYVEDYLLEKLKISINGEAKQLEYVGKELVDLAMVCFLYIPDVKDIQSMEVSNEVMIHWFNDQVNVTHIDCNDDMKSTFYARGRTSESFIWK